MPFTFPSLQRHSRLPGPHFQVCGYCSGAAYVLDPPIGHDCTARGSHLPSLPSLPNLPESLPALDIGRVNLLLWKVVQYNSYFCRAMPG